MALQYGVPLKVLVDKYTHMRFEPSGFTNNSNIPIAKSLCDYIFRWLSLKFLENQQVPAPVSELTNLEPTLQFAKEGNSKIEQSEKVIFQTQADAPPCHECGSIMVRSGSCYKCLQCGSTSGCS